MLPRWIPVPSFSFAGYQLCLCPFTLHNDQTSSLRGQVWAGVPVYSDVELNACSLSLHVAASPKPAAQPPQTSFLSSLLIGFILCSLGLVGASDPQNLSGPEESSTLLISWIAPQPKVAFYPQLKRKDKISTDKPGRDF